MNAKYDARFEALRVLAALSIFLAHFIGDLSVTGDTTFSRWARPLAAFGITAFIALSGALLAVHRQTVSDRGYLRQVRTRLGKLLPMYWFVALPIIGVALATHRMASGDLWKVPMWLTGLGWLRADTFWPVVDAWWYMSVAIQIALIGPLLVAGVRRWGWAAAGAVAALADVGVRLVLGRAQLPWVMNGLVVSYAAVLVAGAALVALDDRLRSHDGEGIQQPGIALLCCLVAMVFTGRTLELSALAGLALALAAPRPSPGRLPRALILAGALTYPFYLSHSPLAKYSIALGPRWGAPLPAIVLADLGAAVAVAALFYGAFKLLTAQRERARVGALSEE